MSFAFSTSSVLYFFTGIFLLIYPSITLLVHGGASALLIGAAFISLIALLCRYRANLSIVSIPLLRAICVALASPFLMMLVSEIWHQTLLMRALDAPLRFLIAIPLFMVVARLPKSILKWTDLSFAFGAISGLIVMWFFPGDAADRLSSRFLNAIHFGDIALLLGVLSALSINWWNKDSVAVRCVKYVGLIAGLIVSVLSGSRGGWIAIPMIAVLIIYVQACRKTAWWRWALFGCVVLSMLAVYFLSDNLRERLDMIYLNLSEYTQGNKDTSIGVRLQLYRTAMILFCQHPIFGLGPEGFAHHLQALVDLGQLTPLAAQLGRGEVHNQLLAYMVSAGTLGGVALLSIYIIPGIFFWQYLNASDRQTQRVALMGLVFVLAFGVFGLTVETFNLKMTVSFYATLLAVLVGITAHRSAYQE